MGTVSAVLVVLMVLSLMVVSACVTLMKVMNDRVMQLYSQAKENVQKSEDMAAKIAEAHNSLSHKVIEVASQVEMLRSRMEFLKK